MGARRSYKSTFDPSSLSAVSGWLRNSTLSGGVATWPDVINGASADATQSTPTNQPTGDAAGDLTFDGVDNWVSWPLTAANNGAVKRGLVIWLDPATVAAGLRTIWAVQISAGSSMNSLLILQSGADLIIDVNVPAGGIRRATLAGVLTTNPAMLTWEYDGDAATDLTKCVVTLDTVVQTPVFSDSSGTPGAMPAALAVGTGSGAIGVQNTATNLRPFNGRIGRNVWPLASKMTEATEGLLTTQARTNLFNLEPMT